MPKQIYRCNYCYHDEETYEECLEHESTCSRNPELKNCLSCEFYVDVGMPISGSMYQCQNPNAEKFEKFQRYSEEKEPCTSWEKEK